MTDRLSIEKWQREGKGNPEIARLLGVTRQTVWRELQRGAYERLDSETWETKIAYSPDIAQAKYRENMEAKGPQLKIADDFEYARRLAKVLKSGRRRSRSARRSDTGKATRSIPQRTRERPRCSH